MTIPRVLSPDAKAGNYKISTATEKRSHKGGSSSQSYQGGKVKKWKQGLAKKRKQGHL